MTTYFILVLTFSRYEAVKWDQNTFFYSLNFTWNLRPALINQTDVTYFSWFRDKRDKMDLKGYNIQILPIEFSVRYAFSSLNLSV